MIKFIGHRGGSGRSVLGIGLTRANCERLQAGQPIHFHAEQMDVASLQVQEVMIFFGETEATMEADFRKAGLLETAQVIDERDRRPS